MRFQLRYLCLIGLLALAARGRAFQVALWPAYDPETQLYGYVSTFGQFIISPRFTAATSFSGEYAVVTEKGEEFYIDGDGKRQKFRPEDPDARLDLFWNGYAIVGKTDRYGLIDKKFRYVLEPHYSELAYPSASGLLYYGTPKSIGLGFITVKGEQRIIPRYPMASEFVNGHAVVTTDGVSFGLINERGHYLIPERHTLLWPLWDGYCMYENREYETGILDQHGRLTLEPGKYTILQQDYRLDNRSHVLVMDEDSLRGYIDVFGNPFINCIYVDASEFSEGFASVKQDDGTYTLIDERDQIYFSAAQCRPLTAVHTGVILLYHDRTHEFRYYTVDGTLFYSWTDPNPEHTCDPKIDHSYQASTDRRYPGSNFGLPF